MDPLFSMQDRQILRHLVHDGLWVVLLACAIGCMPAGVHAQPTTQVVFERVEVANGAQPTPVTSIAQDAQGFMWFGTYDGLMRYDGERATTFRHDPEDTTSLSDDYINIGGLYAAPGSDLWVGTRRGGLNRYDPIKGRFQRFKHHPDDPGSLAGDFVGDVLRTHGDTLWVGTIRGVSRYDATVPGFVTYQHDPEDAYTLSNNAVTSLAEDVEGTLWVGTRRGLNRYDAKQDRMVRYPLEAPGYAHPCDDIFTLYADAEGRLWIGSWGGGLCVLDLKRSALAVFPGREGGTGQLSSPQVSAIRPGEAGTMWVGTWGGGLNRYDPATGQFTVYRHDPMAPQSVSHDRIAALYRDRGGVLWVATWAGVDKVVPRKAFAAYTYGPGTPYGLSHPTVSQVYEDRAGIQWIGTLGGGLNRLDPATGTVTVYRHSPADPGSLSHDEVSSIVEDGTGNLWVGTFGAGLNRFNAATGSFTPYRHDPTDPNSVSSDLVYNLYVDRQGDLWVGTVDHSLNRYDPSTGHFVRYYADAQRPEALSAPTVWPMYEDREGILWVGTFDGGLNRYDRATQTFTRFVHDPSNPSSLSSNRVIAINEDADGALWVGTMGGGLNRFDRATGRFRAYGVAEGLPHAHVACILPGTEGTFWISTSQGLSRFTPATESFVNYTTADGLPGMAYYFNACHAGQNGALFFGSDRGLLLFHPEEIVDRATLPNVVITEFALYNTPVPLDSVIASKRRIEVGYKDNFVAFQFGLLDYAAPQEHTFSYRLEGLDEGWVDAAGRTYASYPNLPSGTYTFRVRGTNSEGVSQEAQMGLHIATPFWQQYWFHGLSLLVVMLLVSYAYRRRTQAIQQRSKRLAAINAHLHQEMDERRRAEVATQQAQQELLRQKQHEKEHIEAELERLQAQLVRQTRLATIGQVATGIAHELRNPLGAVRNAAYFIQRQFPGSKPTWFPYLNLIDHEIGDANRIINNILEMTRGKPPEVQAVDVRQLLLHTFAALERPEHVQLDLDGIPAPFAIQVDPHQFGQVLLNLMVNAVQAMGKAGGTITVTTSRDEQQDTITIADTGPGIAPDLRPQVFEPLFTTKAQGTGLGLSISRQIVTSHAGTLDLGEGETGGAVFVIRLPRCVVPDNTAVA